MFSHSYIGNVQQRFLTTIQEKEILAMPIKNDFYFEFDITSRLSDIANEYEVPINQVRTILDYQLTKTSDVENALAKTIESIKAHCDKSYANTESGDDLCLDLEVCDMCAVTRLLDFKFGEAIKVEGNNWKEQVDFSNVGVASCITWEDIVILSAIYTVLNHKLKCVPNVVDTYTSVKINADEVYHVLLPKMPLQVKGTRKCYLTMNEFLQKVNETIAKFKMLSGSYQTFTRKSIRLNWEPIENYEIDEDFYLNTNGFSNGKGWFRVSKCQEIAVNGSRMNKKVFREFLAKGKQPHNTWLDMLVKTYLVFQSLVRTKNRCVEIKGIGRAIGFRSDFDGSYKSKQKVERILNELNEAKGKNGKSYNLGFKLVGMTITWNKNKQEGALK